MHVLDPQFSQPASDIFKDAVLEMTTSLANREAKSHFVTLQGKTLIAKVEASLADSSTTPESSLIDGAVELVFEMGCRLIVLQASQELLKENL